MLVQTCAHCWNYDRLLTLHLSALVHEPPREHSYIETIFYSEEDQRTVDVLRYFERIEVPNVQWDFQEMPTRSLCRRAIGRDLVARETIADYVMYFDVDYVAGGEALDKAVDAMLALGEPTLAFPGTVYVSPTHADGDREIAKVTKIDVWPINHETYVPSTLTRAIGGAQWLPASVLREKGYLEPGHKFLRPEPRWRRTYEDMRARTYWALPQVPLKLNGFYRVRHGKRGRFDVGVRL